MSSPLAIAAVTHVLKDLLNDGIHNNDLSVIVNDPVLVSSLPPDRVEKDVETSGKTRLNLFLYMVTLNPGWRNEFLPARNIKGERVSNPPLVLDLHYLLTAYGEQELHQEILLGYGMQLLHENPILAKDAIRKSLSPNTPANLGTLPASLQRITQSGLADQIEQVKISPELLNSEEISKLWTAFGAKYRLHAAYKITTVILESAKMTKSSLPVRERIIRVAPFNNPFIEKIGIQANQNEPVLYDQKITVGQRIVIVGQHLKGEAPKVVIGNQTPPLIHIEDTQITLILPANLPAGVQSIQVVHDMMLGSPPTSHKGVVSNVYAFVLNPLISNHNYSSGTKTLSITANPPVNPGQRVVLMLNEDSTNTPHAYAFQMSDSVFGSPPQPLTILTFELKSVAAGTYFARIQVDGAESPVGLKKKSPQIVIS